jgi:hypothetical protein
MDDKYTPPESSTGDTLYAFARAIIGSIPVFGSAAAVELFQMLIMPAMENRKQAWMEAVAEGLRQLESKHHFTIEDLAKNEVFIDTLMQASQSSLRTNNQEKRAALRNAVLNAALPNSSDESLQQMFIRWVDEFTVWHLRILHFFQDAQGWLKKEGRPHPNTNYIHGILTYAYPDLTDKRDLYNQIWSDLYNRGLVNTEGLLGNVSETGPYDKRTTSLGDQFLAFIADQTE